MFIDEAKIYVKGGDGGRGCVSFHHEKFRPLGGPDGGSGGSGGNVYCEATPHLNTLAEFIHRRHFRAKNGSPGEGNNRHGANAHDLVITVPVGTQVKDENGRLLADLAFPGQRVLVAKGGRGGRGNASFVNPRRRTPKFAERGEAGEERWIILELKVLADVGVVGLPNVGKSTFITHISQAKPRIADYPFTTLDPVLGVVEVSEYESFVVADLPGLIEGASKGKGLGHKFLRHVERTKLLLHMLDLSTADQRDPLEDLERINRELGSYSPSLLEKPQLVLGNKIDIASRELVERIAGEMRARGYDFHPVSALTGEGIRELILKVAERLREIGDVPVGAPLPPGKTIFTYDPSLEKGFEVVAEGKGFRVKGAAVERMVSMTDLENPEALLYLQRRLRGMGVERELERRGARPGDPIYIGKEVFDFFPD